MTKIKIVDMKERVQFIAPGKRQTLVDILYSSAKGYSGTVTIPKDELTEKRILNAIRADVETQEKLLGTEIEV